MMTDRRPILVAGKSGQLARSLVDAAGRGGIQLLALGRPDLDLRDSATINRAVRAIQPYAIINAAAYTAVDQSEANVECAFVINRDGAARLAKVAATAGVPFVHISTDYVFDGCKASPYREDDTPAPLSIYGRSKRDGEIAVQQICSWAFILRTSWVYSPYGRNFVTTMLKFAQERSVVQVVDDQHGAPTAAADIADAILRILMRPQSGTSAGVYHLTAAGDATWCEFAKAIFTSLSRRGWRTPELQCISTAHYPTAAKRPVNSRLDCRKIAEVFGIRLPDWHISLETCLDALTESFLKSSQQC